MRGRSDRVAFAVYRTCPSAEKGDAQLELRQPTVRPRLREKGSSALHAQENALLNKPRLLPGIYARTHERRAPKALHVGRRNSAIQGRRPGEWLGQHRSRSADVTKLELKAPVTAPAAASTLAESEGGRRARSFSG